MIGASFLIAFADSARLGRLSPIAYFVRFAAWQMLRLLAEVPRILGGQTLSYTRG